MGDKTGIEWTDATWNPTTGCDKVSRGCDNCYAMTLAPRLKAMGSAHYQRDGDPATSGPGFAYTEHPDALDKPLRWQRPRRIFVNSMSDLFHSDATREFQAEVFAVMAMAKQHTFQLLTKRPGVMRSVLSSPEWRALIGAALARRGSTVNIWSPDQWPLPNVWVGTSVEDQAAADLRVAPLLATPAAVRFLSMEPLLGPVDLTHLDVEGRLPGAYWINALSGRNTDMARPCPDAPSLDWIIVGGESGPGSRPMAAAWARGLRDQCQQAAVPFHFKQWGNWLPYDDPAGDADSNRLVPVHAEFHQWPGGAFSVRLHKKEAGRVLDGRTWDEWPVADRG